jgi:hypothetical protein
LDATTQSVCLNDSNNGADLVEDVRHRIVHVLALCDREESTVAVERRLNGFDGSGAPRGDGDRDTGVHDGIAQREDW